MKKFLGLAAAIGLSACGATSEHSTVSSTTDGGTFKGVRCTFHENSTAPDALTNFRIYLDTQKNSWVVEVAPAKVVPVTYELGALEQAGSFLVSFKNALLYRSNLSQLDIIQGTKVLSFNLGECKDL